MKNLRPFFIMSVILISLFAGWEYYKVHKTPKQVYVLTQKVFSEYKGTQELMQKLSKQELSQKSTLDSLAAAAAVFEKSKNVIEFRKIETEYRRLYQKYSEENSTANENYTAQAWSQINQYIQEYGKSKNYPYILGANGSGSVMYADSSLNITTEVIRYLNNRYEGK